MVQVAEQPKRRILHRSARDAALAIQLTSQEDNYEIQTEDTITETKDENAIVNDKDNTKEEEEDEQLISSLKTSIPKKGRKSTTPKKPVDKKKVDSIGTDTKSPINTSTANKPESELHTPTTPSKRKTPEKKMIQTRTQTDDLPKQVKDGWKCKECTFLNPRAKPICQICNSNPKTPKKKKVAKTENTAWSCPKCTYENIALAKKCTMCSTKRKKLQKRDMEKAVDDAVLKAIRKQEDQQKENELRKSKDQQKEQKRMEDERRKDELKAEEQKKEEAKRKRMVAELNNRRLMIEDDNKDIVMEVVERNDSIGSAGSTSRAARIRKDKSVANPSSKKVMLMIEKKVEDTNDEESVGPVKRVKVDMNEKPVPNLKKTSPFKEKQDSPPLNVTNVYTQLKQAFLEQNKQGKVEKIATSPIPWAAEEQKHERKSVKERNVEKVSPPIKKALSPTNIKVYVEPLKPNTTNYSRQMDNSTSPENPKVYVEPPKPKANYNSYPRMDSNIPLQQHPQQTFILLPPNISQITNDQTTSSLSTPAAQPLTQAQQSYLNLVVQPNPSNIPPLPIHHPKIQPNTIPALQQPQPRIPTNQLQTESMFLTEIKTLLQSYTKPLYDEIQLLKGICSKQHDRLVVLERKIDDKFCNCNTKSNDTDEVVVVNNTLQSTTTSAHTNSISLPTNNTASLANNPMPILTTSSKLIPTISSSINHSCNFCHHQVNHNIVPRNNNMFTKDEIFHMCSAHREQYKH